MKAIRFNTGRQYTPEGQIVIAWVVREETDDIGSWYTVRFDDTSRMVSGEIEGIGRFDQEHVMARYDLGQYKNVWITGEEKAAALAAVS